MGAAMAAPGFDGFSHSTFTLRTVCAQIAHEDYAAPFAARTRVVRASIETIGRYFDERLRSVFFAVANEPKVLRNSKGSPLYLLCFGVGNEKGSRIALSIANHLLSKKGWS